MKTSFLFAIPPVLIFFFLFITSPAGGVGPAKSFHKSDPLASSIDLLFSKEVDLSNRLNWRERVALKILKKKLKKRLKEGSGSIAFSFSQPQNGGCITLVLKNGQSMKVDVVQMNENEVIVFNCRFHEGGQMTIPWNNVIEVRGNIKTSEMVIEAKEYLLNDKIKKLQGECVELEMRYGKNRKGKLVRRDSGKIILMPCEEVGGEFVVPMELIRTVRSENHEVKIDVTVEPKIEGFAVLAAGYGVMGLVAAIVQLTIWWPLTVLGGVLSVLFFGFISWLRLRSKPERFKKSSLTFLKIAVVAGVIGAFAFLLFAFS